MLANAMCGVQLCESDQLVIQPPDARFGSPSMKPVADSVDSVHVFGRTGLARQA